MNDPGLDEPISNDAKDVEHQQQDEQDEKEEDEQAFLEPRYVGIVLHHAAELGGRQSVPVHLNSQAQNCGPFRIASTGSSFQKADHIYVQSMVVRPHSFPTHSWNFRAHGISIQYLRPSHSLESLHTAWSSRAEWRSNRRSEVVRSILRYSRTPH